MKTKVQALYEEWCGEDRHINDCHPVHDSSETIEFAEYYYNAMKETVLDLTGATPDQKQLIIKELVETTAKAVLTVFIALGLKTHIESKVVNDATGDEYVLKFNKIEKITSDSDGD